MARSIRWRLQAWYALVLLAVVAGFAAILYSEVRTARLREVDAGLTAAAIYLDVNLRRFPPHVLRGPPPDDFFDDGPPFDGPPPDGPRFKGPPHDRPPPGRRKKGGPPGRPPPP